MLLESEEIGVVRRLAIYLKNIQFVPCIQVSYTEQDPIQEELPIARCAACSSVNVLNAICCECSLRTTLEHLHVKMAAQENAEARARNMSGLMLAPANLKRLNFLFYRLMRAMLFAKSVIPALVPAANDANSDDDGMEQYLEKEENAAVCPLCNLSCVGSDDRCVVCVVDLARALVTRTRKPIVDKVAPFWNNTTQEFLDDLAPVMRTLVGNLCPLPSVIEATPVQVNMPIEAAPEQPLLSTNPVPLPSTPEPLPEEPAAPATPLPASTSAPAPEDEDEVAPAPEPVAQSRRRLENGSKRPRSLKRAIVEDSDSDRETAPTVKRRQTAQLRPADQGPSRNKSENQSAKLSTALRDLANGISQNRQLEVVDIQTHAAVHSLFLTFMRVLEKQGMSHTFRQFPELRGNVEDVLKDLRLFNLKVSDDVKTTTKYEEAKRAIDVVIRCLQAIKREMASVSKQTSL